MDPADVGFAVSSSSVAFVVLGSESNFDFDGSMEPQGMVTDEAVAEDTASVGSVAQTAADLEPTSKFKT